MRIKIENNLKWFILRFVSVFIFLCYVFHVYVSWEMRIDKIQALQARDILKGPAMQDDPFIVDLLRTHYLIPPSTKPYHVYSKSTTDDHSEIADSKKEIIKEYIDTKNSSGFFIECRAYDGETLSNTLKIEMDYKWSGLLVEPNNEAFAQLKTLNRKAWLLNACLSPKPYTSQFTFNTNPANSVNKGRIHFHKYSEASKKAPVLCFPLYAVLVALNVTIVDYFSLDMEGKELDVLKTIPFDKVKFKIFTIEQWLFPGGQHAVMKFMRSKNFTLVREVINELTYYFVYVHNSLVNKNSI